MKKALSIWLAIVCLSLAAHAQTVYCPSNVDFEQGTFSGWTLYTGSCCPISTPTIGVSSGRHTITSGLATDPYGNFPVVSPAGGSYSLKLGNSGTGSQAERARYYIRVPSNLSNYSLIMRYAVVLQDPQHDASEQPRFEVKAFDSITNAVLPCAQFSFVASSSLPGFVRSSANNTVFYKSWSTVSIDLSGKGGRTIAIDFASGDCDAGAHFGYGYVDLTCGLFKISSVVCKGSTTSPLTAPPGFQSYKWYDSTFSTLIGTTQNVTVPTPATYYKYHVVLSPYPGYGCPDTLETTLTVSDLFLRVNRDTIMCNNGSIALNDSSFASAQFQPLTYAWTPSTGLSCANCLNPVATPTATTKYKLKVTDATGCTETDSFNILVQLRINSQPVSKLQCLHSKAVYKVVAAGMGPFLYQWRKNGVDIPGALADSLVLNNILFPDTGTYDVRITGNCGSTISEPAKLDIYNIRVSTQPAGVLQCPGTTATLKAKTVTNGTFSQYQWYKAGASIGGATKDSLRLTGLSGNDTGAYFMVAFGQCDTTVSDTVRVDLIRTGVVQSPDSLSQCSGTPATFRVTVTPGVPYSYQWRRNGTNIPGATLDSLFFPSIAHTDSGNYTVMVRTTCDSALSAGAYLDVRKITNISTQPLILRTCFANDVMVRVSADGYGPLSYVWSKNQQVIAGSTGDSLPLTNISYNDTGTYICVVSAGCGVDSVEEQVQVFPSTFVLSHPVSVFNCHDTDVVFRIKAGGIDSLKYQWLRNGTAIANATADSFRLEHIKDSDSLDYYAVMIRGGCDTVESMAARVHLYAIPQPQLPDTTKLCVAIGKLGSAGFNHYLWSTGDVTDSTAITSDGQYWLHVTDQHQCTNADTTYVTLMQSTSADAGRDTVLCNELGLALTGLAIHHDFVKWTSSVPGLFAGADQLNTGFAVSNAYTGSAVLKLTAYNYCGEDEDEMQVEFRAKVSSMFVPSDTVLCINEPPVTLLPLNAGGIFYGDTGIHGNFYHPLKNGLHEIVHRIHANGCSDTTRYIVRVIPAPVAEFTYTPAKPSTDSVVRFHSTGPNTLYYLWDFGTGAVSFERDPVYLYDKYGTYAITLIAMNEGCSDTITKLIKLNGMGNVWVPNAFTPNGDGENDIFHVVYNNSRQAMLSIYNRWGQLVYRTDDPRKGWDGTMNGTPCTVDTYVYVVDYENNEDEMRQLRGQVTLLR